MRFLNGEIIFLGGIFFLRFLYQETKKGVSMRKTITLLTILLFVVFMVGCENSINPIEPTNNQEISLAKQSNPDEAIANLAKGGNTPNESHVSMIIFLG